MAGRLRLRRTGPCSTTALAMASRSMAAGPFRRRKLRPYGRLRRRPYGRFRWRRLRRRSHGRVWRRPHGWRRRPLPLIHNFASRSASGGLGPPDFVWRLRQSNSREASTLSLHMRGNRRSARAFFKHEGAAMATPANQKEVVMTRTFLKPRRSRWAWPLLFRYPLFPAPSRTPSAEPAPTPSAPCEGCNPYAHNDRSRRAFAERTIPDARLGGGRPEQRFGRTAPGARHAARRYASRNGNRYDGNPVRTAATGVAGGVADLGSIAAYPFYCFPNYGSCSVKVPYRF